MSGLINSGLINSALLNGAESNDISVEPANSIFNPFRHHWVSEPYEASQVEAYLLETLSQSNQFGDIYTSSDFHAVILGDDGPAESRSLHRNNLSGTYSISPDSESGWIRIFATDIVSGTIVWHQVKYYDRMSGVIKYPWSVKLPKGQFFVTIHFEGCQPVSHGPFVFENQ